MNFFAFDIRKLFLVFLFIVLPIVAVNMQKNSSEDLWFTRPFTAIADGFQGVFHRFSSGVRGTTALYINLVDVKTRNRLLTKENAELRAQLGDSDELKLENLRLSRLLGFSQKSKMELLSSRVIGVDTMIEHNSLKISRGINHEVRNRQAAITVGGVVGYVFRSEPKTAQILLLTDRYSAIDAIVQRSRARGIVEGRGDELVRLRYLRRDDDVQVGDLVVTSGLHGIFPKGFPIGSVQKIVKKEYGMTQEVVVKPSVDTAILEELFVILDPKNQAYEVESEQSVSPSEPLKAQDSVLKNTQSLRDRNAAQLENSLNPRVALKEQAQDQ